MKVLSTSNPQAIMSLAFSRASLLHSAIVKFFHKNFSSSVSCITTGTLKASCKYLKMVLIVKKYYPWYQHNNTSYYNARFVKEPTFSVDDINIAHILWNGTYLCLGNWQFLQHATGCKEYCKIYFLLRSHEINQESFHWTRLCSMSTFLFHCWAYWTCKLT